MTPGDPAYGRLRSTYFRGGAPGIVLLPRTVEQVVDAVDFAGRHLHLPLGIRSGGHGLSGRSTNDGGIVIDLRHLNGTHVLDPAAQLVRIGPGARWRDVAAALQPHGWALSSGDSGAVGVGGLATSGGSHLPSALNAIYAAAVAAALHPVFQTAAAMMVVAFALSWRLRDVPLRDTTQAPVEASERALRTLAGSSASDG